MFRITVCFMFLGFFFGGLAGLISEDSYFYPFFRAPSLISTILFGLCIVYYGYINFAREQEYLQNTISNVEIAQRGLIILFFAILGGSIFIVGGLLGFRNKMAWSKN